MTEILTGSNPIGIFDSGLGGLTVVRQILKQLPEETIYYFGDTARVPYGSKGNNTVKHFALQIALFLESQRVKLLVVACNTASSVALELLKESISIPVVGVIVPGCRAAVTHTRTGHVAVLGTTSTISSEAYNRIIHQMNPSISVYGMPCPLFVPLVEEGWEDHPVAFQIAKEYLKDVLSMPVDTIILGCTHYPFLRNTLRQIVPGSVQLVDSSIETARAVKQVVEEKNIANLETNHTHRFFVSDFPQKFHEIAARFLGAPLENVVHIPTESLDKHNIYSFIND
jgi:glutamate racemase